MLDLDELKERQTKAYNSSIATRRQGSDDLIFCYVSQWDDVMASQVPLQYQGQFDIIRRTIRKIAAEIYANPVQIDFRPKNGGKQDAADLLDGLYLNDERHNASIEAYDNAITEAIVCGHSGWLLYTEYESDRSGREYQVIRRRPLHEMNNNVFWDPDGMLLDKSDADWGTILLPFSEDGYVKIVKELTGETISGSDWSSFFEPEQSYTFPWIGMGETPNVYLGEIYHKDEIKDKILTLSDPFGGTIELKESDSSKYLDELKGTGYQVQSEREIKRTEITRYIANGREILSHETIAGENIPIIPMFGERQYIEGEEWWEGVVRLAKDPQRMRNFLLSYLMDIVGTSPRPKPIFGAEQLQNFRFMYETPGADNQFPYYLQNLFTADGQELPGGPVGMMPEAKLPDALIAAIDMSRTAIDDVASSGIPKDLTDPDLSGKAIDKLNEAVNQQYMLFQKNFKHAKRRDAEVYSSMAADIHDVPREANIYRQDGSSDVVKIMDYSIDEKTGEQTVINDLTTTEIDVFADVGPSYSTKREKTIEKINELLDKIPEGDPMRNILILKEITLMDGENFDDVIKYARNQLILQGIIEPESDEEKQTLAQAQAQAQQETEQPDAATMIGQAEMKKANIEEVKQETERFKALANVEDNQVKREIDMFKAQTDRALAQVAAEKADAEIDYKHIQAFSQRIDSASKLNGESLRSSVNQNAGT